MVSRKDVEKTLFVYFGHHKCGTRWIYAIVRQVCAELGWKHAEVHNPALLASGLGDFTRREKIDFLAYTNADYRHVGSLPGFRGFHVIRDPRDVVVSAYFSHLHSHPERDDWPELIEHRRRLQSLAKEEGLLAEIEFSEPVIRCLGEWPYALPNVLELRMEELMVNPYGRLLDAFRFLGAVDESPIGVRGRVSEILSLGGRWIEARTRGRVRGPFRTGRLPAERVLGIIHENDFARKSGGRAPGEEDVRSHYRKGIAGDWRNHFTPALVDAFKGRYNDVLVKLGYEHDDRW